MIRYQLVGEDGDPLSDWMGYVCLGWMYGSWRDMVRGEEKPVSFNWILNQDEEGSRIVFRKDVYLTEDIYSSLVKIFSSVIDITFPSTLEDLLDMGVINVSLLQDPADVMSAGRVIKRLWSFNKHHLPIIEWFEKGIVSAKEAVALLDVTLECEVYKGMDHYENPKFRVGGEAVVIHPTLYPDSIAEWKEKSVLFPLMVANQPWFFGNKNQQTNTNYLLRKDYLHSIYGTPMSGFATWRYEEAGNRSKCETSFLSYLCDKPVSDYLDEVKKLLPEARKSKELENEINYKTF